MNNWGFYSWCLIFSYHIYFRFIWILLDMLDILFNFPYILSLKILILLLFFIVYIFNNKTGKSLLINQH
jgi:hypothetical protein